MPCETEEQALQAAGQMDAKLDLPEGVPWLGTLYMYISGSCNLACRHCWIVPTYQGSGQDGQHIRFEYVRKAIQEAKPLGLRSVKLTGGEPTLHPQFREIITLLDEGGLAVVIETNGTLIDDDLASFLKQKPNVKFLSVSLDGSTAETHDALRGVSGSYERAVSGIQALVKAGFQPQLICTLHRGNVSQMAEIVTLGERLGCGSVKFNHVQHVGRGEQFAAQQGLEILEIIQLYRRVESELRPKSRVSIYFDIPIAFRSIRTLLDDSLQGCDIRHILGILAGGEMALCGIGTTVPELIYGHLESDSLRDVWCTSPGLALLRELIPAQLEGVCTQCLHRDRCLGACVANNYHVAGKLNAAYQICDRADALGLFPAARRKRLVSLPVSQ